MCTGRRGQTVGTEKEVFESVLLTIDSPGLDNRMPQPIEWPALLERWAHTYHWVFTLLSSRQIPILSPVPPFYRWQNRGTEKFLAKRYIVSKKWGPGEHPRVWSPKHGPISSSHHHPESAGLGSQSCPAPNSMGLECCLEHNRMIKIVAGKCVLLQVTSPVWWESYPVANMGLLSKPWCSLAW